MAGEKKTTLRKLKKRLFGLTTRRASGLKEQKLHRYWESLINATDGGWDLSKKTAEGGPRVLIATTVTNNRVVAPIETTLGVALTQRGAEVQYLVCDEFLPACWMPTSTMYPEIEQFVAQGPRDHCPNCYRKGIRAIEALKLPVHRHSEWVTAQERSQTEASARSIDWPAIRDYRYQGIAVGEHAYAGALRFFATGNLNDQPGAEGVLRRFLQSALMTVIAVARLLEAFKFDCLLSFHGIYVPEGLMGEVARQKEVRVVNWLNAYRQQCFIFSHTNTYHHTMMSEPSEAWETMQWNPAVESQLMDYLASRWDGSRDWISFNRNPEVDLDTIAEATGIDFGKPCIGMLTNVMWDAQLHYPANIFKDMLEWALRTIDYFVKRPDLQLLIRVHPAERTGYIPSRQPILDEIYKVYPRLPENIVVIPPESRFSTYVAMQNCDSVIIYGTKTGVELTSMGIPVIVAGEAWIKNKGITLDPASVTEYFDILARLPLGTRLHDRKVQRARRYAYHFFFRRMIPLEFIAHTTRIHYEVNLDSIEALKPGGYKGLDIICDGILHRGEFIYPAERLTGVEENPQI